MNTDPLPLKEIRQLSRLLYRESGRLNGYLQIDRTAYYSYPLDEERVRTEIQKLEQLLDLLSRYFK